MLIVWKGLFEDGIGLRGDSPEHKGFSGYGTLQLPSSPTDREGGCK